MKISELKKDFKNYLTLQNPEWSLQRVGTNSTDAFFALNNNLINNFFTAIWDEFGIDNIYLAIYDFLLAKNDERALSRSKGYRNAMLGLSNYLHNRFKSLNEFLNSIESSNINEMNEIEESNNKKINLIDYCRETSISYSYKIVLMKAILNIIKEGESLSIDNILNYFDNFYTNKYLSNSLMEKPDSIFSKLNFDLNKAKSLIVKQPLNILYEEGILLHIENGIVLQQYVNEQIILDYEEILRQCNERLKKYYSKLNNDYHYFYSIYEYINSHGDSRFGVTRAEFNGREGEKDSCILRYSKLNDDEAYKILEKLRENNATVNYFGNPLHILQFDKNGRLINSFDSIFEAGCIVGRKPLDIKAYCKGEKEDLFFIWKYGKESLIEKNNLQKERCMREQFETWLRSTTSLSNISIKKYCSALDAISKDMLDVHVIARNIYFEQNIMEFREIKLLILKNKYFVMKNQRGNNMYSVALQHYEKFLMDLPLN